MADRPKLKGPSRSLNSRPRINSMKDRGKPRVPNSGHKLYRGHTNRRYRHYNRKRHYYHPLVRPAIVVTTTIVTKAPSIISVRKPQKPAESSHVTIFIQSDSKRFGATSRGGLIIFPEKPKMKTMNQILKECMDRANR